MRRVTFSLGWLAIAACGTPPSTSAPMMPGAALPPDEIDPPGRDEPLVEAPPPASPPKKVKAQVPPADPPPGRRATLLGVSVDKRRALLRLEKQPEHWVDPMFRWVDIETQRVIEEWREPALSGMPLETMRDGGGIIREPDVTGEALEADIATRATALLEAGSPFEPRFAATREVSLLNLGDWLYIADSRSGKVGDRLSKEASYYPHVSHDGTFAVYSRHTGLLDGVFGNYMPYVVPLPAGAPSRKLNVRDIDGWKMELSRDGRYLYVQSGNELPDGGCLVRATIAAPSPVKKLYCVEKDERIRSIAFSPSRHMVVVTVAHSDVENRASRALWVELPDGKVVAELKRPYLFEVATVDDGGIALGGGMAAHKPMVRVDPWKQTFTVYETDIWVPFAFYGAAWIDADRWVIGEGGGTRTIDLSALPKTTVPWSAAE